MKLGKIFICINILVLSLLMLTGCTEKWPRIIYQNTDYRFDEHNRTIVLDGGHSYDIVETENGYDIIFHFIQNENCTEGERKTLKIIKNNYAPSNVRTICPICDSIFEFDPATECNERTVICPCCHKSFAIGEKYIEIGRVTYAVAI